VRFSAGSPCPSPEGCGGSAGGAGGSGGALGAAPPNADGPLSSEPTTDVSGVPVAGGDGAAAVRS
jgi:hypothetical protein